MDRAFALEKALKEVNLFEPGTAEVLDMAKSFADFHDHLLVDREASSLLADAFRDWTAQGGAITDSSHCIGYHKPLFQGGDDDLDNLKLIDMDVYWTVSAPFIAKARTILLAEQ